MKPIWYFFQVFLFIVCSPNAIFQVPSLWRNLGKIQVAFIHGVIFTFCMYILYESTIIRDLWDGPQKKTHKEKQEQTKIELSPDHAVFQSGMGYGSK